MAQSIKNLALGSKIKDSKGNKFIIIAHNHYSTNEVTLLSESAVCNMYMAPLPSQNLEYPNTEVAYYLNNNYLNTLDEKLKEIISTTKLPYSNSISMTQYENKRVNTKAFLLSCKEIGVNTSSSHSFPNENNISYVVNNKRKIFLDYTWTRTETSSSYMSSFFVAKEETTKTSSLNEYYKVQPAFNLPSDALVSDNVSDGYFCFIFNNPTVINTISNIKGSYGSNTKITYTAIDNDDTDLTHYISFDNGSSWSEINPSRVNDTYTYNHVFSELNNYSCRIKVADNSGNETVSNMFMVEVSNSAPSVNIVGVKGKVITFKVNCITDEISRVEVSINDVVKKTYTNNFDFNLIYEINSGDLNVGDNKVEIKATSSANIINTKYLEVSKKSYTLPAIGTKVLVNGFEYSIAKTSSNGSTHTYTLDKNLLTNLKANDIVRVMQDRVNVKCSLSNVSTNKDFKDMKLVKSKILKGALEGYIEEKYELEGEGRYSTIRLELERFNSNSENEIIELQQAFDYLED